MRPHYNEGPLCERRRVTQSAVRALVLERWSEVRGLGVWITAEYRFVSQALFIVAEART